MSGIAYTWRGYWDNGAGGWAEFFGGADGLPCRDLTAEDVAGFSADQTEKLVSECGKRLYEPVTKTGRTNTASAADPVPEP